ncbi:MAG TPA: glycine cleavage system protein GcvH [Rhodocyclaceae bacterium]|jgi:glycine cleavage system H protein|nr:glycine cleavage system protein GcvH [Betaproteobacteria bacterium]HMU99963.1 glycine cleavage system protein GcvH [Rhodocyclaceae bacterium]HMV20727.1 glycine cleavage system protein GcvH [Rhodocyclaceae bacterium]HNE42709.1 glycine cleavage system protein GcvH [Rhodocyclaceae bacterium]HNM22649.1 glycine cleavage system protein GcvH [Rhodocyclaceae bacterium]
MSNAPAHLKYTASHEWLRLDADGTVTVGITDHAQEALGDLVFVELPEVGAHFDAEKELAVVESVKAAADVYAPIAGTVTAVNQDAADAPESVNQDAYAAWLFRMKPDDAADLDKLLDAAAYQAVADAA